MSLRDRLLKNSDIAMMLKDSDIFKGIATVSTHIPVLDIILSGEIGKGLSRGLTIIAGPSKHFKSLLGLIIVKRYLEEYPDAICMFYDSEGGTTEDYYKSIGINPDQVVIAEVATLEQLRHEAAKALEAVEKGENIIFYVDSIGNLASSKEVEDALQGKDKADMTRAKVVKSFTRIAAGYLNTKDIPMIVIGHTYNTMEMYSKPVLSGGSGPIYNANNIIFMGRQQDKDVKSKDILGYDFIMTVEKSRFVKEATRLPIRVRHGTGIHKYGGLAEIALEGGYITKSRPGYYKRNCVADDKAWNAKKEVDIEDEFWNPILKETDFREYVKRKYQLKTVLFTEEKD